MLCDSGWLSGLVVRSGCLVDSGLVRLTRSGLVGKVDSVRLGCLVWSGWVGLLNQTVDSVWSGQVWLDEEEH